MKKSILFFAFTLFSFCISAQTHLIGLQGGLNLSNIQASEEANYDRDFRIASISGITYELILNDKYSFGADLLFNQQGMSYEIPLKDENNTNLGNATVVSQFDYISIPLKFGYAFGDKLRFTPKVGLIPSFLINAKTKTSSEISSFPEDVEEDYTDVTEKVDIAAVFEVTVDYSLKNRLSVFSSLSYRNSFTNYSKLYENIQLYHYGIALSVGVKYNLAG